MSKDHKRWRKYVHLLLEALIAINSKTKKNASKLDEKYKFYIPYLPDM
jgi:hypothetical protein